MTFCNSVFTFNVSYFKITVNIALYPNRVSRGVDFDAAQQARLRVIWALSLPGKVAPITSGKIIKDTIVNILTEMGWYNGVKR